MRKLMKQFAVIEALIRARINANLSQAELAKRIGTTQSAIARLEGGGVSPSLADSSPLREGHWHDNAHRIAAKLT